MNIPNSPTAKSTVELTEMEAIVSKSVIVKKPKYFAPGSPSTRIGPDVVPVLVVAVMLKRPNGFGSA